MKTKKIVINKCYGGFGLSDAAYERLIELGVPVEPYSEKSFLTRVGQASAPRIESLYNSADPGAKKMQKIIRKKYTCNMRNYRDDSRLVQIVQELEDAANGECAELVIVEIPDGVDWEIHEYDGHESIHETHRSWE